MQLPAEDYVPSFFTDPPISVSNASSQNDIQASLDDLLFKQLLNCSTIRDQACLHAVPHSSGISSGWLKHRLHIPYPELENQGNQQFHSALKCGVTESRSRFTILCYLLYSVMTGCL